ncbi:rhodopsin, G0-coupled-like [Argopecten irradians]|uniref:rhodopsin, G0-coupled-like n=1 Tax=Argopecten irradians TaxID=31199 RepID=UPI003719A2E7
MVRIWSNISNGNQPSGALGIQPSGYRTIGIIISIVSVLGISGNLLIVLVFTKRRSVRRPINFFVLNLALSDLFVALIGYPMTAVSAFSNRWIFESAGCKLYAFICFNSGVSSIMTHAALGFCRYVIVCKYGYRKKITETMVLKIIFCIWFFALFWTVSPLLGWSSYVEEIIPVSCSLNWFGQEVGDLTYTVSVIVAIYMFPLSVITFSYGMILRKKLCISTRRNETRTRQGYMPRYIQDLEQRVTLISFMMMSAFIVAWTPYAIMSGMSVASFNFNHSVAALPTLFAKASCAYNPFIYAFTNSTFRDSLKEMVAPWTRRRVGVAAFTLWPRVTYYQQRRTNSVIYTVGNDLPDERLFMANSLNTNSSNERIRRIRANSGLYSQTVRIEPRDPVIISPNSNNVDFSAI